MSERHPDDPGYRYNNSFNYGAPLSHSNNLPQQNWTPPSNKGYDNLTDPNGYPLQPQKDPILSYAQNISSDETEE